jgi:hypothetical protein
VTGSGPREPGLSLLLSPDDAIRHKCGGTLFRKPGEDALQSVG